MTADMDLQRQAWTCGLVKKKSINLSKVKVAHSRGKGSVSPKVRVAHPKLVQYIDQLTRFDLSK